MLSAVGALGSAFLLLPLVARGLVQLFGVLLRGTIWVAASVGRGDDVWTIAAALGRGATAALLTPSALGVLGGLLALGALALFGLQRVLESEDQEE